MPTGLAVLGLSGAAGLCPAEPPREGGSRGETGRFPSWLVAEKPHVLTPLPRKEVDPVHEAHPVAPRAHDERVRPGAVGEVSHSTEQVTVRDPRRTEDHLARHEVLDR